MSHIHLIGGEKGGVGKSLVSRILARYFIDKGLPFAAFDSDKSHGSLIRFYGQFSQPVDTGELESLDRIVESAAEDTNRRVLVDLAAQTQEGLAKWIDDSGVFDVTQELGIGLSYWHVMDAGRDSVDLLTSLLDRFAGRLPLVIVLNELRGDKFELLTTSGQRERALSAGAKIVSLRKLPDVTMQKMDALSTSFWAAVHHPDRASTGLGVLERQRVKVWLARAYEEIDRIGV